MYGRARSAGVEAELQGHAGDERGAAPGKRTLTAGMAPSRRRPTAPSSADRPPLLDHGDDMDPFGLHLLDPTSPDPGHGGPAGSAVQWFGGEEHKVMAETATGGERLREFADLGLDLSFGDGVMLAGDVLAYLESEQPADPQQHRSAVDYLREQLRHGGHRGLDEVRFAIWFARADKLRGREPDVPDDIKVRVRSRYLKLAKDNIDHFSHGGTARETYLALHTEACRKAFDAGVHQQPARFEQAKTDEAFAQHYLSDMFSGGHVRTPRRALDREERNRDLPSIEHLVAALAQDIYRELDAMDDFGNLTAIPGVPDHIVNQIIGVIKDRGGDDLQQGSYAALVSKALHDRDNDGIEVVSARGPDGPTPHGGHRWRAVGDGHVLDDRGHLKAEGADTFRMVTLAMEVSRRELDAARAAGRTAFDAGFTLESIGGGRAVDYVPAEVTGMNANLSPDSPAWDAAVDRAIRHELLPRLLAFFPDVITVNDRREATLTQGGRVLHVGAAMKRVAGKIDASPSDWLRGAMQIHLPSGHGQPPPGIAGVPGPPTDAGVSP